MAQFVVAAAGAAVGFAVGGPMGAQIGWGLGAVLGSSLGPGQHSEGPRLQDLRAPKAQYGAKWPRIYGRVRTAGIIVWQSDLEEVATTEHQGGKGGPDVSSTTFSYYRSVLFGFAEYAFGAGIVPTAVTRIWRNGKLIWSALNDSEAATLDASAATTAFDSQTFFDGNASQMPWTVYEAAVGTENANAYRYRATLGLERIAYGQTDQMPYFEFEVVTEATGNFAVGGVGNTTEGAGTHPILPDGVIAGDGLILYILHQNILAVPSFASAWGSNVTNTFDSSSSMGLSVFARLADGSADDALMDFTVSGVSDGGCVWGVVSLHGIDDPHFPSGLTGAGGDYNTATEASSVGPDPGQVGKPDGGNQLCIATAVLVGKPLIDDPPTISAAGIRGVPAGYTQCCFQQIDGLFSPDEYSAQLVLAFKTYTGIFENPGYFYDGGGSYFGGGAAAMSLALTYNPASGATVGTEDLADIVSQEHLRANGGDSTEFDVSELVGIPVYGEAFADTARSAIEQLMAAFYFEAVCSDKVYYHLRGGDSVVTVPFDDTAAGENQPSNTPFVGPARDNPAEIPGKVTVTYTNLDADYDAGSEEGDRVVTSSNEIRQYQVGIVTTPDKAKGIADTIAADNYFAAQKAKVQLDDSYAYLEPTDVVTNTDEDGNTYRMRIVETMYSGGTYDHQEVLDDASILVEVGITSNQYTPVIDIAVIAGDTELLLIDGPIESDADDGAGIYALLKPATGDSWTPSGGALYQSTDGSTYSQVGTVTNAATFGTASTTLGDYTGPRMFDEGNSVTVDVGDGTLTSSTNEALINDATINRFALGADGRWEYGQFRDAELISAGVYRLTGFLRGSRGTEHLTGTHTSSDTFALLNGVGQIRVPLTTAQIGSTRYYKGVTVGRSQSTASAQLLSDDAVGLQPFTPVDLKAVREPSGDVTLTWIRRSRLSCSLIGTSGIIIPLGETVEAYTVTIYTDNTYATAARTISATSETATYTSAQQIADFGSVPSAIYWRVRQVGTIDGIDSGDGSGSTPSTTTRAVYFDFPAFFTTTSYAVASYIDTRIDGAILYKGLLPAGYGEPNAFLVSDVSAGTPASLNTSGNTWKQTGGSVNTVTVTSVGVSYSQTYATNWNSGFGNVMVFLAGAGIFERVEWTGDGTGARDIAHSLGVAPVLAMAKHNATEDWYLYSSEAGAGNSLRFPSTAGASFAADANTFPSTSTSTDLKIGSNINASGELYLALLFSGTSSDVSAGTYTGNGSASGPSISLGFEPAMLLVRNIDGSNAWTLVTTSALDGTGKTHWFIDDLGTSPATSALVTLNADGFDVVSADVAVNENTVTYQYWALKP